MSRSTIILLALGAVSTFPAEAAPGPQSYTLKLAEELNNTTVRLGGAVRHLDPFGLPVSTADMALAAEETPKNEAPQKPTLLEAVRELHIDGVNGGLGEFMVGSRIIRLGDILTLSHKGIRFEARVVEVRPFAVQYEDVQAGTKATVTLNIIPQ